jgi:hypothetical protein
MLVLVRLVNTSPTQQNYATAHWDVKQQRSNFQLGTYFFLTKEYHQIQ